MIVYKQHPRWELGTRASVETCAERARVGGIDPKTVAWAREKLVQAGYPQGVVAQASAMLEAVRRERFYVPDPYDSEFVPDAACTLKGCHGLKFLGEDCDGLLVAFLAAVRAIGIAGAVVGHSYTPDGRITHVLGAVFDGQNWIRCDPSTTQPFGQVSAPTREQWVAVHDGRLLCDQKGMCTNLPRPDAVLRPYADYIGVVSGPASGLVGDPPAQAPVQGITGTPEDQAQMVAEVAGKTAAMRLALGRLQQSHDTFIEQRKVMDLPITDVDIVQGAPSAQATTDTSWTQEQENNYQSVIVAAQQSISYGDEVSSGKRQVARRADNGDIVLLGSAGEPAIVTADDLSQTELLNFPGQTTLQSGTVGIGPYVAVAIVVGAAVYEIVMSTIAYYALHEVCGVIKAHCDATSLRDLQRDFESKIKSGMTPEQAIQAQKDEADIVAKVIKARTDQDKSTPNPVAPFLDTFQTLLWVAAGVGVLYVGGVLVINAMASRRGGGGSELIGLPVYER